MKTFHFFASALFLSALMAASVFAQTNPPQQLGVTKFAVIYTDSFGDPKQGITKYITSITTLNKEFESSEMEIKAMGIRYETLRKEIEGLQSQIGKPNSPVNAASVQPKIDEYGKLGRELQFKQEDIKAKYQSRANVIIGPIMNDIGRALQDYAKQKGYGVIFDAGKLEDAGFIVGTIDEKADVTKDFIAFYNARPATGPANTQK